MFLRTLHSPVRLLNRYANPEHVLEDIQNQRYIDANFDQGCNSGEEDDTIHLGLKACTQIVQEITETRVSMYFSLGERVGSFSFNVSKHADGCAHMHRTLTGLGRTPVPTLTNNSVTILLFSPRLRYVSNQKPNRKTSPCITLEAINSERIKSASRQSEADRIQSQSNALLASSSALFKPPGTGGCSNAAFVVGIGVKAASVLVAEATAVVSVSAMVEALIGEEFLSPLL